MKGATAYNYLGTTTDKLKIVHTQKQTFAPRSITLLNGCWKCCIPSKHKRNMKAECDNIHTLIYFVVAGVNTKMKIYFVCHVQFWSCAKMMRVLSWSKTIFYATWKQNLNYQGYYMQKTLLLYKSYLYFHEKGKRQRHTLMQPCPPSWTR